MTAEVQQQLREWMGAQSDLTLAELQLRLGEKCQLAVSLSRLWSVLRAMGMRLKKSRFTPLSNNARMWRPPAKLGVRTNRI